MKLRDYQKEDMKVLKKLFKKHDHILFGASTGYGKSVVILEQVKRIYKKGGRVLIIAPRRKLVSQLVYTLSEYDPVLIMGSDTTYQGDYDSVIIASTQTLNSRFKKYGKDYLGDLDMIIIDEVHMNFSSKSMEPLKEYYWDTCKWLGLSATPIDERGYRLEGWDYTHYKYQTKDLIDIGYLTKVKVMVEDAPEGLSDINMTGGDYSEGELADLMMDNAKVSNVYQVWKKYAKKRNTMIFAVTINHAMIIYDEFISNGVKTGIIHSELGEQEEAKTLKQFNSGELRVLINVSKLTTGYDEPRVDCLLLARPTKSLRLFIQIIGRGVRLYEGKKNCLVLDLAGTVAQHGYPTMRRDFDKIKPPPREKGEIELVEKECPNCAYATQLRNCPRTVQELPHITITTWRCPNCDDVLRENSVDNREVERLKLVKDYTNTSKVTNTDVHNMVEDIRELYGYKAGWVSYIAKLYNKNDKFKEFIKKEVNKVDAGMTSLPTVLKNINKFKKSL